MKLRNFFAADDAEPKGKRMQLAPLAPRVSCEIEGCRQASIVRNRANVSMCLWHYEHEFDVQARDYAEDHDLRSTRDHIEHCKMLAKGFGKAWPRERTIAQWRKVQANPKTYIAAQIAQEALANLHAEAQREPGEDL